MCQSLGRKSYHLPRAAPLTGGSVTCLVTLGDEGRGLRLSSPEAVWTGMRAVAV